MLGRASQLCMRALGNMGPRGRPKAGIETDTWPTGYPRSQDPAPHKLGRPKVWCGHGAVVSVRGRCGGGGGGDDGGCIWRGGGESCPGRVADGRGGVLSVVAGACQGCPSSRLPWTVSDQPTGCWMMRAGSEASREVCRAGVMAAKAWPRRASASVTYTTVWRLCVRVAAMEACAPRRRPETRTMMDAAGEEPTGDKVGTAEAEVAPAAGSAGAPGGRGGLRQGGAGSGAGGAVAPGLVRWALVGRRSQDGTSLGTLRCAEGGRFWCRR